MPEAALNLDNFFKTRKDEVGPSRKVGSVKAVAETKAIGNLTYTHVRRSVLRPDSGDVSRPALWGYRIHAARRYVLFCMSGRPASLARTCKTALARGGGTAFVTCCI